MILAVIQARMGSTRLPEKILLKLEDKTVLEHIIGRVGRSKHVDKTVVATTVNPSDDRLEDFIRSNTSCSVFRGSEDNVLERFYLCAKEHSPDIIVRVTADDPLKDPEIIDRAIGYILEDPALDYCSNTIQPTFPEGLDIEVFRFRALEKAWREARLPSETEHVTPYIWKNPSLFKLKNFVHEEDLSAWRWTLDKPEDFEFIRRIYGHFYPANPCFNYRDIISFLKANPEVLEINRGTVRNEGYLKTLKGEGSL